MAAASIMLEQETAYSGSKKGQEERVKTSHPALGRLIAVAMADFDISFMDTGSSQEVDSFISRAITTLNLQEAFYVMDLGVVVRLYRQWVQALPRVRPFYAVKCAPEPALLKLLATLGSNFDCASKAEIDQVLALGVGPDRIIFANPCKMPKHIAHAANMGVHTSTFDSEAELHKVKQIDPEARLLLRLRADDKGARCPLGVKYGALRSEWEPLLRTVQDLDLNLVGVSFHVGSGACEPSAFTDAISSARAVFDLVLKLGLPPLTVLDIGGGFTSGSSNGGMKFVDAASAVNEALDAHFPPEANVEIVAEPGRYFAEVPSTLAACVFGRRVRGNHREYWINDGIYGSMNCMMYDHAVLSARPLLVASQWEHNATHFPSTVFGPTCDGLDTVMRETPLPDLAIGDWMVFPNMGAYTAASGSSFNGFATSELQTFYVYSVAGDLERADSEASDSETVWSDSGVSCDEPPPLGGGAEDSASPISPDALLSGSCCRSSPIPHSVGK